ncbi:hypothetical protein CR513_33874, partial [Mucuna pruriens]
MCLALNKSTAKHLVKHLKETTSIPSRLVDIGLPELRRLLRCIWSYVGEQDATLVKFMKPKKNPSPINMSILVHIRKTYTFGFSFNVSDTSFTLSNKTKIISFVH